MHQKAENLPETSKYSNLLLSAYCSNRKDPHCQETSKLSLQHIFPANAKKFKGSNNAYLFSHSNN
jgi:hypothetical protein